MSTEDSNAAGGPPGMEVATRLERAAAFLEEHGVDPGTGAIVRPELYRDLLDQQAVQVEPPGGAPYLPAFAPLPSEVSKAILAPMLSTEIAIRPDGMPYWPGVHYTRRLNEAFGPGGWQLRPSGETADWFDTADNQVYARRQLWVYNAATGREQLVREAVGEAEYFPKNASMTYATALESASTNALMRCCKALGIASELWDPAFTKAWTAANAVAVWCDHQKPADLKPGQSAKKKLWRLKTAPPIDQWPWKEAGGGTSARGATDAAVKNGARKADVSGDSTQGVNLHGSAPENAVARPAGASTGIPERPWPPEVLKRMLARRAGTVEEGLKTVPLEPDIDNAYWGMYEKAAAALFGGDVELRAAAIGYLFDWKAGGPDLTYAQRYAYVAWAYGPPGTPGGAHTTNNTTLDAATEALLLKMELTRLGVYAPVTAG